MTDQEMKSLDREMIKAEVDAKEVAEKKKQRKALNVVGYAVGSVALFVVACTTLPNILSNVSGALYKSSLKKTNRDDEWGPVIERKETPVEAEQLEKTELQEEDGADGD